MLNISPTTIKALSNFRKSKWFIAFIACLLIGGFVLLTSEVHEARLGQIELIDKIDRTSMDFFIGQRTQSLNDLAKAITSLGSVTVLSIVTILFSFFFAFKRRVTDFFQLLGAATGASLITWCLKLYFGRSRPHITMRLVEVDGFSYPSGHSLSAAAIYFTIALILSKPIQASCIKYTVWLLFFGLILTIGVTRIYLGVHFFSDVLGGVLVGIAWASLIKFIVERRNERAVFNGRQMSLK